MVACTTQWKGEDSVWSLDKADPREYCCLENCTIHVAYVAWQRYSGNGEPMSGHFSKERSYKTLE